MKNLLVRYGFCIFSRMDIQMANSSDVAPAGSSSNFTTVRQKAGSSTQAQPVPRNEGVFVDHLVLGKNGTKSNNPSSTQLAHSTAPQESKNSSAIPKNINERHVSKDNPAR